jgi:peptide/nickel transport system substrate-binding protein
VKYPFDLAKAKDLMAQAGWNPGPDGVLVNAAGERFSIEGRASSDAKEDVAVQLVTIDFWKRLGVEVQVNNMPDRLLNSEEFRNRWPGAFWGAMSLKYDELTERWHSRSIPTEENRWTLSNWARWNNPKADAIMDEMDSIITPERERELNLEFAKLFNEELPALTLYSAAEITTVTKRITNVTPRANTGSFPLVTWNMHEWGG